MSKPLSREEELALFERIKNGDTAAKDIIIEKNMWIVNKEAVKHIKSGLDFEDLVQEGCIGLLKAIEKFDTSKGYRFGTYAVWWVKQTIGRAIANYGRNIRIPANMDHELNKIKAAKERLYTESGTEPKNEDIAEALNMTPERVEKVLNFDYAALSLDYPLDDNEDKSGDFHKFIVDETAFVEDIIFEEMISNEIKEILSELPERESEILKMYFGFYGHEYYLKDIGRIFNLSVETIRQIKNKAIRRLKYGKYKIELNKLVRY